MKSYSNSLIMKKIYFAFTVLLSIVSIHAKTTIIGCPTAGTDGSITICETNSSSIFLADIIVGENFGGTWIRTSGIGGVFDGLTGTYIVAPGSTTSTFMYTVSGAFPCLDDSSTVTINVNQQPNAGIPGSITICDSSFTTIDLFSLLTGEQTGGTWTRIIGAGGIFDAIAGTYIPTSGATISIFECRIAGVAPCVDDFSMVTININQQPDAGIDGCISVSDETPFIIDLYSLITGEQVGGIWTRTSGSGGTFDALAATYVPAIGATTSTFTYSTIGTPPCVDDNSVATIVINGPPCGTLSSTNFDSNLFEYYPNPINDVLNLKFAKAIKNVQIVNVLGQEVFNSDYNENDLQINLSHLISGTYIVTAMVTTTIRTFKIVKN